MGFKIVRLKNTLFLASQSSRRHDGLLEKGIPFTEIPNLLGKEPSYEAGESFSAYVMRLSYLKAAASKEGYRGCVVGMDTIVVFEDEVYGKPATMAEASQTLLRFSGGTQRVLSAVTLIDTINQIQRSMVEENTVYFNDYSEEAVLSYCEQFEVLDKAGGYGIQDCLGSLISHYEGSFESIMGLPIKSLLQILKECDMIE